MDIVTQNHPIEHILLQLKGVKSLHNGRGYTACCPAHNDSETSLTIWEDGPDRTGIHCYGGCSQTSVLEAIGLTWHDLYKEGKETKPSGGITLYDLAVDKHI